MSFTPQSLFSITSTLARAAADLASLPPSLASAGPLPHVDASHPPESPSAAYINAKTAVIDAAEKLVALVRTPRDSLIELSFQHCATATLQLVLRYRLHHAVPLDSASTFTNVADAVGLPDKVPVSLVERLLQHSMSFGVFAPAPDGKVAHNAASALLVNDPDLEAWLYLCTNIAYPAGAQLPKALEKYGASSEANETAYSVYIGRHVSQFERFREPDGHAEHEMFARAMKGISAGGAYDVHHVVHGGYPWNELPEGTLLVDVGGGPGHVAMALAENYPNLEFLVQDLPETVQFGNDSCPSRLRSRIRFEAHDFFAIQPEHRVGDPRPIVYFARFILHDWSDKYAKKIVGAISPRMRPQDRLVLNEVVIPEPGKGALQIERKCHDRDLLMLMNLNGRERTLAAFGSVFDAVEPRLCVSRVHRPPLGELSLIEAVVDTKSV
ncbi:S-adenosyl-L-methionine-dependent methyltransferase [Corynespora cassiicola Philippines]|uniref:S-adenosyl-L-methionine-dependent methyltransferase n=1 Tax=Corynespora cassiicola Philippines TaxID=1448308 RepID=A0A2T2NAC8_CORCC|nr:S-adenosyl-L-methionine-dependent methyltransferase [Corynespora cassiicola Philippines]